MAKELPYFKFEPSEWQNGNIQMCSPEARITFIDICCSYWQRLGDLPYAFALQRHCLGNAEVMQELIDAEVLHENNGILSINFLDEQIIELSEKSEKARKSALKRWNKSERNANASKPQSERNANRIEENRIEENKKEIKKDVFSFNDFWEKYPKKIAKSKCKVKFDKLKETEKEEIKNTIEDFLNYKPFADYTHPNPETYINQKRWEDEIPKRINGSNQRNDGKVVVSQSNQRM